MSQRGTIESDCMTLTRYVLTEQKKIPYATGELTQLLASLLTAIKAVSNAVRKAGLASIFGLAGNRNVQGEDVKKLDVIANDLFINMLSSSFTTAMMVSEENETVIEVDLHHQGKYCVMFDPLDGSSNIDCLVSIGSIFGIFRKTQDKVSKKDFLQPGRNFVAAGYALYGSATMVVLSVGGPVNGFMLDPSIGEFVLTTPNMMIPSRGKIYSCNEGNYCKWNPAVKEYVDSKKSTEHGNPYQARYIGSMVADVHRTLCYGGIFFYPDATDAPKGKLRMLYECLPMAFIIEKAGGLATTGKMPVLEAVPEHIHDRCPIFLGSKDDVEDVIELYKKHGFCS